jgi:hypothetical protein
MLVPEACFRSCLQKHVSEAVLIVQKLFCASEAVLVQKLFCGSEAVISLYFKLKLFELFDDRNLRFGYYWLLIWLLKTIWFGCSLWL